MNHDYDINIFETAGLADAFDLEEYGFAYTTSADLAAYILFEENACPFFTGIQQYATRWFFNSANPTPQLWEDVAADWQASTQYGGLVEWNALKGTPADFVEKTFQAVQAALFGGLHK